MDSCSIIRTGHVRKGAKVRAVVGRCPANASGVLLPDIILTIVYQIRSAAARTSRSPRRTYRRVTIVLE